MERGALAGRGEPLALAVSPESRVYVCDVGNNRVQRFDEMGRVDRVAGGDIGLSDVFLGAEVPYYVTGSTPGEAPGRFVQPLAIVVFTVSEGERVAVVDAARNLQLLDGDLRPVRSWKVDTEAPVGGGIGIAGPSLMVHKDTLYCVWGRDLIAYGLDGTVRATVTLSRAIRVATLYRGKMIAHAGGTPLLRYGLDGFDYGPFVHLDPAWLMEDLDLSAGPDGFLYVHTDLGKLIKINRRGKVKAVTETLGKPMPNARIAVGPSAVYVSFQDRIHRFPLP